MNYMRVVKGINNTKVYISSWTDIRKRRLKRMETLWIDSYYAALLLIEILLETGEINQATYTNIMKHRK